MPHCAPRRSNSAFTLIELLVVIAIIAILVALLIPGMGVARNAAKRARAQNDVKQIETAFRSYMMEYGRAPTGLVGYDDANAEDTSTGIQMNFNVVAMLMGEDINGMNPKRIRFLDVPTNHVMKGGVKLLDRLAGVLHPTSLQYVDPWWTEDRDHPGEGPNAYKYMLDYDGDNRIKLHWTDTVVTTNLDRTVAVWSRGRDHSDRGSAEDSKDNVLSW